MFGKRIQARDQFLSKSTDEPRARRLISESWKRSRQYHVNPCIPHAPFVPTDEELRSIRSRSRVYRAFAKIMHQLDTFLGDKYAVALAEKDGMIVDLFAKGKLYENLCAVHFSPGGMWKEEQAGTNAIGTAIATGGSVVIHDAEHYCESWQPYSCAGTPIFHPRQMGIVGVLDVTSFVDDFPENSMLLTGVLAKQVEWELRHEIELERLILENYYAQWVWNFPNDFLLCMDADARIVCSNLPFHPLTSLHGCDIQRINWGHFFEGVSKIGSVRWTEMPLALEGMSGRRVLAVNALPIHYEKRLIGVLIQIPKPKSLIQGSVHMVPIRGSASPLPPPSEVAGLPSEEKLATLRTPVGESPPWIEVLQRALRVAHRDVTVLLIGESGTGKEEIAKYIHNNSDRHNQPFVAYNCAAMTHDLAASELFGYAPGAFTGALRTGRPGLFEAAEGGTLFLDEISELPMTVQAMLLRVLQERQVIRIGEYRSRPVNVRIIAATNCDLEAAVRNGRFRLDLYYRLNTVTLHLPPLRERVADIPLLAGYFLWLKRNQGLSFTIDPDVLVRLIHYRWPGNVRELKNALDHACLFAEDGIIRPEHLPEHIKKAQVVTSSDPCDAGAVGSSSLFKGDTKSIDSTLDQKQQILHILQSTRYNISKAAKLMGISRGTLYKRLKQFNIEV
ncbi:MAG: sigma-54-dependent Fis family transcriptional regulator [Kyrpidia sp.]|nr:sigma-54-dependent Fis family transcriptional regulator [Kyrpidia sp.]